MSLASLMLTSMLANGHAQLTMWRTMPNAFDYALDALTHAREYVSPTASSWSATDDAFTKNVRVPALESVAASLSADGKKLEITGKRKIEKCQCESDTIGEIELPYRPRPDDITLKLHADDRVLEVALARRAEDVAAAATPISVSVADESKPATRPLRFVPHESATAAPSVDKQEKSLVDKFRDVAATAVRAKEAEAALSSESAATADAAATEGAAVPATDAPPAGAETK